MAACDLRLYLVRRARDLMGADLRIWVSLKQQAGPNRLDRGDW
jgi:hypothetical protein